MTPTRFRALREHLALSVADTALRVPNPNGRTGVTTRTIARWESGTTHLPAEAAEWLQTWVDRTEVHVSWAIDQRPAEIQLYTSQNQYLADMPHGWLTWHWWNRCAGRIAAATGCELTYQPVAQALDLTACERVE